jgi:hypothetical protein
MWLCVAGGIGCDMMDIGVLGVEIGYVSGWCGWCGWWLTSCGNVGDMEFGGWLHGLLCHTIWLANKSCGMVGSSRVVWSRLEVAQHSGGNISMGGGQLWNFRCSN